MALSDMQLERYARHVILPEIDESGQERLLAASVLVVGAGGLGAPALLYLAAAGVGHIGLIDSDVVELSNLQRQVIHEMAMLGHAKTESAAARLRALNPDCRLTLWPDRLNTSNAGEIVSKFDLVIDGSDNFPTRYLLNDCCYAARKPLVSGALMRFEAQLSCFKAYLGNPHPCYRCIFPEAPPPGLVPRCEEAGIIGALPGIIGAWQAMEAIKELLNLGDSLSGRLILFNALKSETQTISISRRRDCILCHESIEHSRSAISYLPLHPSV